MLEKLHPHGVNFPYEGSSGDIGTVLPRSFFQGQGTHSFNYQVSCLLGAHSCVLLHTLPSARVFQGELSGSRWQNWHGTALTWEGKAAEWGCEDKQVQLQRSACQAGLSGSLCSAICKLVPGWNSGRLVQMHPYLLGHPKRPFSLFPGPSLII